MTFYEILLKQFNEHGVKYLIVGGIAVNLYGSDRTTKDLDIWIDNTGQNLNRIYNAFKVMGYSDDGTKEAVERLKQGETVIVPDRDNNLLKVDVMGLYSSFLEFNTAYSNVNHISLGTVNADVISIDDLIATKIKSGRDKDLLDAKNLQEIKRMIEKDKNDKGGSID